MPLNSPVSVVVCTDGRCGSLSMLNEALGQQAHPLFEIIYVVGPTNDGTMELVTGWSRRQPLKILRCPERNLSMARNIGIRGASGHLIAFIDDDAVPDRDWLANLSRAFMKPGVGGVGGAVFEPSGVAYQFLYSSADRLGNSHHDLRPRPEIESYPFSARFPHVMGANCMFKRDALVAIGGFDEEFEYYLDETDLCCRLIDAGYQIVQKKNALVYHKFLENELRTSDRILITKYPILKNKLYYSLRNGRTYYSEDDIFGHVRSFFEMHRMDLARHVAAGRVDRRALEAFDKDAEKAWRVGSAKAAQSERIMRAPSWFHNSTAFVAQCSSGAGGKAAHVFLAADGSSLAKASAIARRAAAKSSDEVHLIVADRTGLDDVSFVDNIWVRRRSRNYQERPEEARRLGIPEEVWSAFAAVNSEIRRIEALRPIRKITGVSGIGLAHSLEMTGWQGDIECLAPPNAAAISEYLGYTVSENVGAALNDMLIGYKSKIKESTRVSLAQ